MIKLSPQSITWPLSLVALLLIVANCFSLIAQAFGYHDVGGLVPLFDMDLEQNLPSFFSSFLAIVASALLLTNSIIRKKVSRPWKSWAGLSAIFLFVAMDEFIGMHEQLSQPMRELFDAHGLLFFAWIIPYGVLAMVLAGVYGRFVLQMPVRIRNGLLLAATLFLAGAVGFEMLAGLLFEYSEMNKTAAYNMIATIAESLEFAGMIVFIHTLLNYIENVQRNILLQIGTYDPLAEIVRIAEMARQSVYGMDDR